MPLGIKSSLHDGIHKTPCDLAPVWFFILISSYFSPAILHIDFIQYPKRADHSRLSVSLSSNQFHALYTTCPEHTYLPFSPSELLLILRISAQT